VLVFDVATPTPERCEGMPVGSSEICALTFDAEGALVVMDAECELLAIARDGTPLVRSRERADKAGAEEVREESVVTVELGENGAAEAMAVDASELSVLWDDRKRTVLALSKLFDAPTHALPPPLQMVALVQQALLEDDVPHTAHKAKYVVGGTLGESTAKAQKSGPKSTRAHEELPKSAQKQLHLPRWDQRGAQKCGNDVLAIMNENLADKDGAR